MMGGVPPTFQPMLAASGGRLRGLDLDAWRFEPKLDGWRAVVTVDAGVVRVRTRRGRDITRTVPELAENLPTGLPGHDVVLDGELIAGGGTGSDFYRLGPRLASRDRRRCQVSFVAFDVLWLDGTDTCRQPYAKRRALLESLRIDAGCWRTAEAFAGDPLDLLVACDQLDVEGVVAKRVDSVYRPGARSADWIKVKTPSWRERHAPRRHEH